MIVSPTTSGGDRDGGGSRLGFSRARGRPSSKLTRPASPKSVARRPVFASTAVR